jgi:uncharacterized protein (TIGR01777 family)
MKIVVSGGTGLIGGALIDRLVKAGHSIVILTRSPQKATHPSDNVTFASWSQVESAISGSGAVVNLAGESIAGRRWTVELKKSILSSRVDATSAIVKAINRMSPEHRPKVFVSASAVGFYGDSGDRILTENSPAGGDFLAGVCRMWEAEARGIDKSVRLVIPRIGIVLHPSGGALQKMLLPFKLGIGGPLGSGDQYFPWIHLDDMVTILMECIENESFEGPINAVAPKVVTMNEFSHVLAKILHRPSLFKVPSFALNLALGESAAAVTGSQRVLPEKLDQLSYNWRFAHLDEALRDLLKA